jgi:hypothetical protein
VPRSDFGTLRLYQGRETQALTAADVEEMLAHSPKLSAAELHGSQLFLPQESHQDTYSLCKPRFQGLLDGIGRGMAVLWIIVLAASLMGNVAGTVQNAAVTVIVQGALLAGYGLYAYLLAGVSRNLDAVAATGGVSWHS